MALLSRKVRKQAKKLGVRYSFFFMRANGAQLRKLAALYDAGHLRPVLDTDLPASTRPSTRSPTSNRARPTARSSSRWTSGRRTR